MSTGCCGGGEGETLVFTCAGAAYSGQVANHSGVKLLKDGAGKLFCVAAVAAEIPDKLERARNAAARVGIDGCEDHCVRKVMDKAGVPLDVHVVVTDLGIEKQPAEPHMLTHTKRVVEEVKQQMAQVG